MKSVFYGLVVMVVISGVAALILNNQATSASHAYTSENGSVRLDN